jgi:hypothetical protein
MRAVSLIALAFLAAGPAWAQQPGTNNGAFAHRVTWSFDVVHGVMQGTPAPSIVVQGRPEPEAVGASSSSTTTYSGILAITFTVKLVSVVPAGADLHCTAGVGLNYGVATPVTGDSVELATGLLQSSESVEATVSGNKAVCQFSIPYSWTIPATSSSSTVAVYGLNGAVGIVEEVPATVCVVEPGTACPGSGTSTSQTVLARSTSVDLAGPSTIPANGATTKLTASAVL